MDPKSRFPSEEELKLVWLYTNTLAAQAWTWGIAGQTHKPYS